MKQNRVPEEYLPVFCKELYGLVRAGIPTGEGLRLLREVYALARRELPNAVAAWDDDFSLSLPGLARFRVNVVQQRGQIREQPEDHGRRSDRRGDLGLLCGGSAGTPDGAGYYGYSADVPVNEIRALTAKAPLAAERGF